VCSLMLADQKSRRTPIFRRSTGSARTFCKRSRGILRQVLTSMKQNKPNIVKLDSSAVEDIHALWERAALPTRPQGRDEPQRLRRVIAAGIEIFFGIYDGGELIGVILATHDGRKGWLNRLAIDPRYRRRGLAVDLICHAEEYLGGEGIQIIGALIEDWNNESLNLFKKCGYLLHEDIHYLSKREHPGV
jgi:GNAT superfamily N-acetyltransferase